MEGTPVRGPTGPNALTNKDVLKSLDDQLMKVSPEAVQGVAGKFPGQEQQAMTVMAKASGFGNMESMNALRAAMDPHIKAGAKIFVPGRGSLADNIAYSETKQSFAGQKGVDTSIVKGNDTALDDVKGACTPTLTEGCIVILDKVVLDMTKNKEGFAKELVAKGCKLIEPKGFTSGINMFNAKDTTKIEDHTRRILDRANALVNEGGAKNFDAAVSMALSETTSKTLQDAGVTNAVEVVDPASHAEVSAAGVAQQVSGTQGMTEEEFEQALAGLSDEQKNLAREMLAQTGEVFSPRRFADSLAEKHAEIMAKLAPTPKELVFFLIPESFKSYGMIAIAHAEATGTEPGQYLNGAAEAANLPEGAVIVIWDDVAGSGSSLHMSSSSLGKSKPVHPRAPVIVDFPGKVIVAPIVATDVAEQMFTQNDKKGLKGNVDFDPGSMTKALTNSPFYKSLDEATQINLLMMLQEPGFRQNRLSMAFPHMSPNNNNGLFWRRFARDFIMNRNQNAAKEATPVPAKK